MNIYRIRMYCTVPNEDVYPEDLEIYGREYSTIIEAPIVKDALDIFHSDHPIKCLDDWDIFAEFEGKEYSTASCFGSYQPDSLECIGCENIGSCSADSLYLTGAGKPEDTPKGNLAPDCFGAYKHDRCQRVGKLCDVKVHCARETEAKKQADICRDKDFEKKYINEPKTAPKNNLKEGKPRASFIPMDLLLEYLVPTYEEGDYKYTRESWREGFKISDLYDALQRHLIAFFYKREDLDPDITKPGHKAYHLGAAMFCILSMLWTLKTRPELDDRPTHNLNQKEKDNEENNNVSD